MYIVSRPSTQSCPQMSDSLSCIGVPTIDHSVQRATEEPACCRCVTTPASLTQSPSNGPRISMQLLTRDVIHLDAAKSAIREFVFTNLDGINESPFHAVNTHHILPPTATSRSSGETAILGNGPEAPFETNCTGKSLLAPSPPRLYTPLSISRGSPLWHGSNDHGTMLRGFQCPFCTSCGCQPALCCHFESAAVSERRITLWSHRLR